MKIINIIFNNHNLSQRLLDLIISHSYKYYFEDYADYPDDGSSSEVAPTNPVLLEDSPQYVTGKEFRLYAKP